jgi:hypothetical protein
MATFVEPAHQARFLGLELGVGDADRREAELPPPRDDARRQRRPVARRVAGLDLRSRAQDALPVGRASLDLRR